MGSGTVLQIVSGFRPNVDGMGDFCKLLGDALWSQKSLRSHFLSYRRPESPLSPPGPQEFLPNTVSYPSEATPTALASHLAKLGGETPFEFTILHYGPYGYSRIGEPAQFVGAIEEFAKQTNLLVFFHELYASGKPWQRAFWTNREQRNCVDRLMRVAKVAFASNGKYMRSLQRINPVGRDLIEIPIFSNVGEPVEVLPLAQRARQLVIFGQLPNRVRLYSKHCRTLTDICRLLKIEKVIDLGSGQSPLIPSVLGQAKVESVGWVDEKQVSAWMSDSIAGVVAYWPDVWEKSGVVAAYGAHGLVPILVPLEKRNLPRQAVVPTFKLRNL